MGICDDARKTGLEKIDAAYNPMLKDIITIIENMKKKSLDPTKFYDAKNDEMIDLVTLLSDVGTKRQEQVDEVNKKIESDCDETMEFGQSIIDLVVASYTAGLSEILPKHMTHIDFEEIVSGKPLGGPNSVFNQVREAIFNSIGLGENNDLRKVIENPVGEIKDGINEALKNAGLPFRL